jgi:outer membrane protein OmpA-like peptidoglycan-associated protein
MMRISVTIFFVFFGLTDILKGQPAGFFDLLDYRVRNISLINSRESDISPLIVNGKLFFSSVREEFFGNQKLKEQNMSFYDIYQTEIDEKGNALTRRELVPGFGNLFHEGPASWCEKTGELFVTYSNISEDSQRGMVRKKNVRLRLVIMEEMEGKWVVTREFPFNNPDFHFAHPAISVTGDTLVFSSDMEGGIGNSDLYMSVRKDGQWSEPENLGEEINTPGNEMFPAFGPGGMLLFSSDGHEENYGQLDIYCTFMSENSKPANLGEKINSAFDDFGMVIHTSGKYGYFSSNRPGRGSDDIYLVEFLPLVEIINGRVIADYNDEPVSEAIVHLQDCEGNEISSIQSGVFGNFEFEVPKGFCYQAFAEKKGFLSDLKTYAENTFVELRLKQIVNYRLVVQDFENENYLEAAEVTCNENSWESDTAGVIDLKFDSIYNCNVQVVKEGYFDYTFDLQPGRFTPGAEITDTIRLVRKQINKNFILKSIVYYIDMWRIMPESEPELNTLIKLMNDNPGLRIEIGAHTDSRMEDRYNLWLSQKRAESVLEYMIQKGVPTERLVAKGYGETQLLNHCANGVNCSEEQHLVNRRTEFKILEF